MRAGGHPHGPASFDPAARELTAEAAAAAGLHDLILLEEPQAALYSWIQASAGDWRKQVEVGDVILVIDLGGGTADLSLIAVTESDGSLELTRVAVGDHILLGGDNMDLALAHVVRPSSPPRASSSICGSFRRSPTAAGGEGDPADGPGRRVGPRGGAEPRLQAHRRHPAHGADPREVAKHPDRGILSRWWMPRRGRPSGPAPP